MNASRPSDNHPLVSIRKACLALLSVLAVGTICPGRPATPGRPTPPGRQTSPDRVRRAAPASRLKVIQLPAPVTSSAVSFEQAVLEQQNFEPPGSQRVEMPKVAQLAWATQGVRLPPAVTAPGRARAAGDANPMRVYFILPDGIYLYNPLDHSLQQTGDTDVRGTMAATLLSQPGAPAGGCQIVIAASSREFGARYGSRSRSIMLLQAGRMSQNLQLQAVALGLTFVGVDAVDAAGARRIARLSRDIEPVYAAIVGYPASLVPETPLGQQATVDVGATRTLIVLPSQGFQNEEYLGTRRALEVAGVQVSVASTRLGMVTGVGGGTVRPDMLLNQANVENYDAVVFIGGVGAIDYFNSPVALNLARQAATRRKVLAAIGTAPSILASAGVLKGVRSTAFLSEQGRMVQGGAMYTGNPVEKDNLIVTAVGPVAVGTFAQAILDGLAEVRQSAGR